MAEQFVFLVVKARTKNNDVVFGSNVMPGIK